MYDRMKKSGSNARPYRYGLIQALRATVWVIALLALSAMTHAVTYYVKPGGGTTGGTTWATAFNNPQLALAEPDVTEIWVAAGTYKPGSNQSDTFALEPDVKMYGGFVGTEPATPAGLAMRNPLVNLTYLSGDINGGGLDGGNSVHVVSAVRTCTGGGGEPCECTPEITASTQLDGFIITMGYADETGFNGTYGGGMLILGASLVIQNCVFIENRADKGGGAYVGHPNEGICPLPPAEPMFRSCRFLGNTSAINGGGLQISCCSVVDLVNCVFSHNIAIGTGGAVQLGHVANDRSDLNVYNCTFWDNQAPYGGGGINTGGGTGGDPAHHTVYNCTFWDNDGGDIVDAPPPDQDMIDIENTNWDGNVDVVPFDPEFVDANGTDDMPGTLDDNLRLSCGSDSIDAGDQGWTPVDTYDVDNDGLTDGNNNMPAEKTPTVDRRERVLQGEIDQGAYETPTAPECLGNATDDCMVDVDDLVAVILAWGPCQLPTTACPADVNFDFCNPDGVVNVDDLLTVILNWGVCPCADEGAVAGAIPETYEDCEDMCSSLSGDAWANCMQRCFQTLCLQGHTEFCDD
jgi:hypothetical protein